MKRIVIYAMNEEMAALRPLAEKLEKQGAAARFMNIKYKEAAKCDVALAPAHHLDVVKAIFAKMDSVQVKLIDADMTKEIKEHNKETAPRQGESTRTAEAVEPTVKADAAPVVEPAVEPVPLVNPGPGVDLTNLAPVRKTTPKPKV